MKPLLLAAAALLLLPAAAQAQVAAASVPNTFDGPAARTAPAQPAAVPTAPEISNTPANAASEEMLRTLIAGAQAGAMDYSLLTETLAAAIKAQEGTITPVIQGFGALVSLNFVGSQNGVDVFSAVFANAATQWLIGINEGKVSALRFRPVE